MSTIRASLRRFRDAVAAADVTIWPLTIRLAQQPSDRAEPRIKSGHIVASASARSAS